MAKGKIDYLLNSQVIVLCLLRENPLGAFWSPKITLGFVLVTIRVVVSLD
jgi:hypothetical protein